MDPVPFTFQPMCQRTGCGRAAIFKIAAEWSCGDHQELKNYGLYCNDCVRDHLVETRAKVAAVRCADGESIGLVGVYRLMPGVRDGELPHVPELEHA